MQALVHLLRSQSACKRYTSDRKGGFGAIRLSKIRIAPIPLRVLAVHLERAYEALTASFHQFFLGESIPMPLLFLLPQVALNWCTDEKWDQVNGFCVSVGLSLAGDHRCVSGFGLSRAVPHFSSYTIEGCPEHFCPLPPLIASIFVPSVALICLFSPTASGWSSLQSHRLIPPYSIQGSPSSSILWPPSSSIHWSPPHRPMQRSEGKQECHSSLHPNPFLFHSIRFVGRFHCTASNRPASAATLGSNV